MTPPYVLYNRKNESVALFDGLETARRIARECDLRYEKINKCEAQELKEKKKNKRIKIWEERKK